MYFIDDDEFEFDSVTPEELEELEAEMELEANLNFDEDSEPDDCFYEGETPTREEMLQEMDDEEWAHELDEDSTDSEVKEEYGRYYDERYNDIDYLMFPNGRDLDAEDEDGPLG